MTILPWGEAEDGQSPEEEEPPMPCETYRFLLAPDLWASLTFAGGPVMPADLRMLRRYLALAEEAIAEPPEARHPPKEDAC